MKILTKKKQQKLLNQISNIQNLVMYEIESTEAFEEITDDLSDITFIIGGFSGLDHVLKRIKWSREIFKCFNAEKQKEANIYEKEF